MIELTKDRLLTYDEKLEIYNAILDRLISSQYIGIYKGYCSIIRDVTRNKYSNISVVNSTFGDYETAFDYSDSIDVYYEPTFEIMFPELYKYRPNNLSCFWFPKIDVKSRINILKKVIDDMTNNENLNTDNEN